MALNREALPQAVLTALALFALFIVVILAKPLSILPGYPAVILAFLIWCILPGWFLQRALFADRRTGVVEQTVLAFVMSVALAAVPGALGLWQNWSLTTFAAIYASLAAAVAGIVTLVPGSRSRDRGEGAPEAEGINMPLLMLIVLALLVIVSSPLWVGEDMPRDGDDRIYMGYVNANLNQGLDPSHPVLEDAAGGFGRMAINVWVVLQALIADSAGVPPFNLLLDYLPPLLTLLAVAAIFALARGLFGSTLLALLAAGFVLAFAAIDLSPHTGYGRNIIIRAAQDKMVSAYVLLPLALLLAARYFAKPDLRTYASVALAGVALIVVHPIGLLYFGFGLVFLFVVRLIVERSADALRAGIIVCGPWIVLGLVFLLRLWIVEGFDARPQERELTFLRDVLLTDLPGGLVIGSHHMILHPFFLLAIVAAPLLFLFDRHSIATQLIAGVTLGTLVLFFFPYASTALSEVASDHALWRLPRLIPVPVILGAGAYLILTRVLKRPGWFGRWSLAPLAALAFITAGAAITQDYIGTADGGEFYQRVSDQSIVPLADGSVLIGGLEHIKRSDSRPGETELALLEYLTEYAPPGSVVMIPPAISDRYFPGFLDDVHSADHIGAPDRQLRRALTEAFYDGTLPELVPDRSVDEVLDLLEVDFIVVPPRSELDDELRTFAGFDANDFGVELGEPELVTIEEASGSLIDAWAFDYLSEERIGRPSFTVLQDTDRTNPTLEFLFEAAAITALPGSSVTIVLTFFDEAVGDNTSVVTEITVPDDIDAAERFITRRPVSVEIDPGRTYGFIVSTFPDAPEGANDEDIVLTGVSIKYWPERFTPIGNRGFSIYKR